MRGVAARLAAGAALVAVLLAPSRAPAGAGSTGANLLKAGVGARNLGMGGAATALTGDSSVILANPSLLSDLGGRSLMLMHWPGAAELRTEFLSYTIPVFTGGTAAGTVVFRTLPDIDNEVEGEVPVAVSDGLLAITYAWPVGLKGSHGGVTMKVFNTTLGELKATSAALDLGLTGLWGGSVPLRYGVGICNLGNPIKLESAGEPLPLTVRGGTSWSRKWYPNALTLAMDTSFNVEQDWRISGGLEWLQAGRLGLRAGGTLSRYARPGFSLGAGWKFRSTLIGPEAAYSLDYAYLPFGLQTMYEPTHCFSVFIRF